MFRQLIISLCTISNQLSNFMVCNGLEPMAVLATMNDALTHSLNKTSIKRKSGSGKPSSPRKRRRSGSGKPLSPRKQKREARKKHGNGGASSTKSATNVDRRAKLMALKRERDEEASPEVQAKKDKEKDTQCQKRCGFFITGPSNTVH